MKANYSEVSKEVVERVKEYMKVHVSEYELVNVLRKSEYQQDDYLYTVIAKNVGDAFGGTYTVWTWNDSTGGLYDGEYGISNLMDAYTYVLEKRYTRIPNKDREAKKKLEKFQTYSEYASIMVYLPFEKQFMSVAFEHSGNKFTEDKENGYDACISVNYFEWNGVDFSVYSEKTIPYNKEEKQYDGDIRKVLMDVFVIEMGEIPEFIPLEKA